MNSSEYDRLIARVLGLARATAQLRADFAKARVEARTKERDSTKQLEEARRHAIEGGIKTIEEGIETRRKDDTWKTRGIEVEFDTVARFIAEVESEVHALETRIDDSAVIGDEVLSQMAEVTKRLMSTAQEMSIEELVNEIEARLRRTRSLAADSR